MARLTHSGPVGPPGERGPEGKQGPAGELANTYEYRQETPAATWHIAHHLGRRPSVLVEDSAEDQVEGFIEFLNSNELNVKFSAATSGIAYLN